MKKGLDTNILVYMIDSTDEDKHKRALSLLEDILRNPSEYAVTTQVVAEFLYVVKKKLPVALDDALLLIERLHAKGTIIGSYTIKEVLQAIKHSPKRFWDALIAYTYLSHNIKTILTENTEDFKNIINAINPFDKTIQKE